VAGTLRQLGIPPQAIRRALERGDPEGAIFEAVVLAARADRTVSANDIERAGGLTTSEIAALMDAFGLPAPDPATPAFSPREADVLALLAHVVDVWPAELRVRGARVYGRQLARIAHAQVQEFRAHVQPRLTSENHDRLGALRALRMAFDRLLPIAEPLLVGVHQRWVEHELGQVVVRDAENAVGGTSFPEPSTSRSSSATSRTSRHTRTPKATRRPST